MDVTIIDHATGNTTELQPLAIAFEIDLRLPDFGPTYYAPPKNWEFSFSGHLTRRQCQAWRKIAGILSGRRAKRRARKRRHG